MGRPALPLGTWGKVRTYPLPAGNHRAMADYRDYDGVTRRVERVGTTETNATNNLLEALRDRARKAADGEITPDTKVEALAELYLSQVDRSKLATRTKQEYRATWNRYLKSRCAGLSVRELERVSTANRMITSVRDGNGPGATKHVRAVLTGMCALAVRHDALDKNPVREIESLGKKKRKRERLINAKTAGDALALFHGSADAKRWDLVDMMDSLSALGCRIGELLALDWETSVDFKAGTIRFHGTVIRVTGVGLIVQEHTKTEAGMRTIRPPTWVMDLLKRRHETSKSPWCYPSAVGTLRDPDNTRKYIRKVVEETAFEGLHPHDWRHYVISTLDALGLSAREIADYVGHDDVSTTQDEYMERGVVGEAAGAALANRPIALAAQSRG